MIEQRKEKILKFFTEFFHDLNLDTVQTNNIDKNFLLNDFFGEELREILIEDEMVYLVIIVSLTNFKRSFVLIQSNKLYITTESNSFISIFAEKWGINI